LEEEIALAKEKLQVLVENAGYKLRTMPRVDYTPEARIISIIEDTERFSSGAKIAKFCGTSLMRNLPGKKKTQEIKSRRTSAKSCNSLHRYISNWGQQEGKTEGSYCKSLLS